MVVGGAATILSLLALAWVKEIVGGFLSIFGADPASNEMRIVVIIVATVLMYCLDFAINTGSFPPFLCGELANSSIQCKLGFVPSLSTTAPLINRNWPTLGLAG